MQNAELDDAQTEIARKNTNSLRYADAKHSKWQKTKRN